jgi:hypothetical protein
MKETDANMMPFYNDDNNFHTAIINYKDSINKLEYALGESNNTVIALKA